MAISNSSVINTRYWPEILPLAVEQDINSGAQMSPAPLSLRRFAPAGDRLVQLRNLIVGSSSFSGFTNARLDITYDNKSISNLTAAYPDPYVTIAERISNSFKLWAKSTLNVNITNQSGSAYSAFPVILDLLVTYPNVAQKIIFNLTLTPDEQRISQALNVPLMLQQGIVPQIFDNIWNEYQGYTYTLSDAVNVPTGSADEFRVVVAEPGTAIILTTIGGDIATASDRVQVKIARDDQADYAQVFMHPRADVNRDYVMFIPALNEIRLSVIGLSTVSNFAIRSTFMKVRLTDLLKIRWNLVTRNEVDGNFYDRVKAGLY